MVPYLPRVADAELDRQMQALGAVLIDGPKACGKTATATQRAETVVRLDADPAARALARNAPEVLFARSTPILFDEWQAEPEIWNRVRREVDDRSEKGLYILTGSATPDDEAMRHSGAGRIGLLRMRPMSLFESGHSSGSVSLARLLSGETQPGAARDLDFVDVVRRIVIGGWPELIDANEDTARHWLAGYLSQLAEVDVQSLGVRRDPRNIRRLLVSLARSVGQPVKTTELAADVGGADGPVARDTLVNYLAALDRLHLTDNSAAWRPHMRSRTPLRKAPVRYFIDPSIGPAALNIGTQELLADPNALGLHFEALVVRDLRIYARPLRGIVDSWRDSNGHEIDAIVSVRDNTWGAVEVTLGEDSVDAAAESLLRFARKVDLSRHGEPTFLGVVTAAGNLAYRRDDGCT